MSDPENVAPAILFVDDEATAVKYFQRAIGSLAPVATAGSVEEGKRMLDAHADTLRVLVSDQRMPGAYGNELLEFAKNKYPDIVRILTTAYSEIEHTVEAVNQGQIYRYLQKPWEITALRMELKQALDLANLRREHAQLLREKLMVRQRQVSANRIGALYAVCAGFAGTENFAALETYLAAALAAGVTAPEPDWLMMDYADLVSAEAVRNAQFGEAIRVESARVDGLYQHAAAAEALKVVLEVMKGKLKLAGEDAAIFIDERNPAEYLETRSDLPVSASHISWLALLLWLDARKQAIQVTRSEAGLECRVVAAADGKMSQARLATWIEHFP